MQVSYEKKGLKSVKKRVAQKENVLFWGVLACIALLYIVNAARSPLWYDEGIEYFYSKVLVGTVPAGGDTTTMYQRICTTYQPPLYNILMYVWLFFFDFSDFSFRLSGILITLLGSIGMYKCLKTLTTPFVALLGLTFYMLTDKVMYYTLECGEYCLLLACICWMLYFFVKDLRTPSTKALAGFFLFAILAVYSQYGAVFLVVPLYLALLLHNRNLARRQMLAGTLIAAAAAVPLLVLFVVPQMLRQGSAAVSHAPVFENNLPVDYIKGIFYKLIHYYFFSSAQSPVLGKVPVYLACFAVVLACVGFLLRWRCTESRYLPGTLIASYTLYFVAVLFSFYGYNYWDDRRGTFNLGGRYSLFFIPLLTVVIVYGLYVLQSKIKARKLSAGILAGGCLALCCLSIVNLEIGWKKDDIRDIARLWYDEKGYEATTLLHNWSTANFQFYVMHDERYDPASQEHIWMTDSWIRNASEQEMQTRLEQIGVFDLSELYFVGPCKRYQDSYTTFCKVMEKQGYTVTQLYSGESGLLYLEKAS